MTGHEIKSKMAGTEVVSRSRQKFCKEIPLQLQICSDSTAKRHQMVVFEKAIQI